jgi:hypothetical protein
MKRTVLAPCMTARSAYILDESHCLFCTNALIKGTSKQGEKFSVGIICKFKVVPAQAKKADGGNSCIAPLILSHGTK